MPPSLPEGQKQMHRVMYAGDDYKHHLRAFCTVFVMMYVLMEASSFRSCLYF